MKSRKAVCASTLALVVPFLSAFVACSDDGTLPVNAKSDGSVPTAPTSTEPLPDGAMPVTPKTIETLSGEIKAPMTLSPTKEYLLRGLVTVK
ncbi:MAG: hypothetical protein JNM74_08105, partial [Myxococcales bacterium]|nr:hypothetical protein [Myxococcales bacterium]